MDEAVKKKWVEALRSGQYQQARGAIKRTLPDGTAAYCCLGVLCVELGAEVSPTTNEAVALFGILTPGATRRFIFLNDRGLLTFAQIADAIEAGTPFGSETETDG